MNKVYAALRAHKRLGAFGLEYIGLEAGSQKSSVHIYVRTDRRKIPTPFLDVKMETKLRHGD